MTHDELLAKIDKIIGLSEELYGVYGLSIHKALRAVVELHKPFQVRSLEGELKCLHDSWLYPCPTIQAIEKELK